MTSDMHVVRCSPLSIQSCNLMWLDTVSRYKLSHYQAVAGHNIVCQYLLRPYYNCEHIARMSKTFANWYIAGKFDLPSNETVLLDAMSHAIQFHDAVYETKAEYMPYNEEESALIAVSLIENSALERYADLIRKLILATKHPREKSTALFEGLIRDLDLLGLADPWDTFVESGENIRREFHDVPDETFRVGRLAWATDMLSRGPIFHHNHIENGIDCQSQAQDNLKRLVKELSTSKS